MPSIRPPSIRTLDALLGGTWAWEDDDDDDASSSPTGPAHSLGRNRGEPEHESPSTTH